MSDTPTEADGVHEFSITTGGDGSLFVSSSQFAIRPPKPVHWEPKPDITAHELALAMPVLLMFAGGSRGFIAYPEDHIAALPENVQRHFVVGAS